MRPVLAPIFFYLLNALCTFSSFASDLGVEFDVDEIRPGIFVHRGKHAGLDDPNRADSANIGFIVGKKCVAVIDTGGSISTGRQLRRKITSVTKLPVCYVINTHVHFDHVLGNAAFLADQPEFVGHKNLSEAMAANVTFFEEQFAAELAGSGQPAVIGPTRTIEMQETIDLGDRELLLVANPPAHTDADLTILDKTSGTLWAGDLIFIERLPILDGNLKGWLQWLNENGNAADPVIPGHGPSGLSWADSTQAIRTYLQTLLDETRRAIANGVFLEDALDTVASKAAASWLLNDRHARNVSRAYRELEWE